MLAGAIMVVGGDPSVSFTNIVSIYGNKREPPPWLKCLPNEPTPLTQVSGAAAMLKHGIYAFYTINGS